MCLPSEPLSPTPSQAYDEHGVEVGSSPYPVSPLSGAHLSTEQCKTVLKTRSPEIRISKASLLSLEGHSFPLWDFKVCCLPGWLTWVQCVHIRVLVAAADPALVSSGGCSWAESGFQAGLPVSESRLCLAMAAGPGATNLPFKACLLLCEVAMTTDPTSQDWYVRSEWVNED